MNEKTLVIGANEVGKTNFIQAIRLVLDKSLSEAELEPNDSDFNISNLSDEFRITLYFKDIKEDHILSQLKENISNEGNLVVQFVGFRKKCMNRSRITY